jgi:hypothetical protein
MGSLQGSSGSQLGSQLASQLGRVFLESSIGDNIVFLFVLMEISSMC